MKSTFLKLLRYTKNLRWTNFLSAMSVPVTDCRYDRETDRIFIRSVGHSFSFGEFPLFFQGYNKYCWKFIDNGFIFLFCDHTIFLKKNDLTIRVETEEELFIINEVFIENVYKIESKSDYIVCDIGMNVGITSLFFSQFDNIKLIYGFEPLKPTFECAGFNFALNKKNMPKIRPYNYGLSSADKLLQINYDPYNKGNVGIKNMHLAIKKNAQFEEIELKEASKTLLEIINAHPSKNILVKIDCEGSEYDIIENLASASILRSFNMFIIEWHNMDNHKSRIHNMINCLKENNFLVLGPGDLDKVAGMIYCFANNQIL